jgi:hypothetical protein
MDSQAWVKRAQRFAEQLKQANPRSRVWFGLEPPANAETISEFETASGRRIPDQVRDFFVTATAEFDFGYVWEPNSNADRDVAVDAFKTDTVIGGVESFCSLSRIESACRDELPEILDHALSRYEDPPPFKDAFPIGFTGGGDCLVVASAANENAHPVFYFPHDNVPYYLAPSFVAFLAAWEKICYLDPDLVFPFRVFCKECFDVEEGGGIQASDGALLSKLRSLLLGPS